MLNRCYRLPAILLFSNHRGITNLLLFQHRSRVFCIRRIFLVDRGFGLANARRKTCFLLGRILTNSSRLKFWFFSQNFMTEFIDKSLKFIRKIFHVCKYFLYDYFDLEKRRKSLWSLVYLPRAQSGLNSKINKNHFISREKGVEWIFVKPSVANAQEFWLKI